MVVIEVVTPCELVRKTQNIRSNILLLPSGLAYRLWYSKLCRQFEGKLVTGHKITRRHNAEDHNPHFERCEIRSF
jgi:hypothetical protein